MMAQVKGDKLAKSEGSKSAMLRSPKLGHFW